MEQRDYFAEYTKLIKRATCGAMLRAIVFGYSSDRLADYLKIKNHEKHNLLNEAEEQGVEIPHIQRCKLEGKFAKINIYSIDAQLYRP